MVTLAWKIAPFCMTLPFHYLNSPIRMTTTGHPTFSTFPKVRQPFITPVAHMGQHQRPGSILRCASRRRACQTGLIAEVLATEGNRPYERNIPLEFLILHAKMRRAQAETDLYAMAIEHAREFDFSDNTSVASPLSRFMPPPLPDELCYYDGDPDDEADDFDSEFL
ncbi:hypothetical protein EDD22DRAFT_961625 [Suillus occidentalis]|nr:hypothetical protein EDD22DRAFT_961625 [Suillus occidentalis]